MINFGGTMIKNIIILLNELLIEIRILNRNFEKMFEFQYSENLKFSDDKEELVYYSENGTEKSIQREVWDLSINSVYESTDEISKKLYNHFRNNKIFTIGDLATMTEKRLLTIKHFGKESLRESIQILNKRNLKLGLVKIANK